VSTKTTQENTHFDRLRADYNGAFDEWALQVSRLQAVAASAPSTFAVKEAEERVAEAEIVYRNTRDRLTDDMG
jgi:hypothetical protein